MCTRKQPGPGPQTQDDGKNLHGCFGRQVKEAWKVYAKKHPIIKINRRVFTPGRGWETKRFLLTLPNYHQGKL